MVLKYNIAINHRAFGTGLKTATRFLAGYGGRYMYVMKSLFSLIVFFYCSYASAGTAYIDVQQYAESYEPISSESQMIPLPPNPPKGVIHSIYYLKKNDPTHYQQFLSLIFLKLYRYHIENFEQSYELRVIHGQVSNALLKEVCQFTKSSCIEAEFISSALIYNWYKSSNINWQYESIQNELSRIQKAQNSIQLKLEQLKGSK